MLAAGVKDNVLPPEARATINFRLHQRDSIASVIEHVRKAVDDPKVDVIALKETQNEASKVADRIARPTKLSAAQIQGSFGNIPVAPDLMTAATDSRHYLRCPTPSFVRSVPFRAGRYAAHTRHE